MAKQKTTGSGVVEALKGVSQTAGNMNVAYSTAFKSGIDPVIAKSTARKKEREAKNKAILQEAGRYVSKLDSNVDMVGMDFSDTDKAAVKRSAVLWRDEYATKANELARIQNKTSPEALSLQDEMNEIQSRFVNLRNNLEGIAKYKQEYAANINIHEDDSNVSIYSVAGANEEKLAQGSAILTQSFTINKEGGIVYAEQTTSEELSSTKTITNVTSPGFTYQHNNFEKPFEQATAAVEVAGNLYNQQASKFGPITESEKKLLRQDVNTMLKQRGVLDSFIADDVATSLFDFGDISLDDGKSREDVLKEVENIIVETMSAARKPKSRRVQNLSATQVTIKEREEAFEENRIQIAGPKSGWFWKAFTKKGEKIAYEGGVKNTNEPPAYYVLYDDQGPVPNYQEIPAGNMQLWQSINN